MSKEKIEKGFMAGLCNFQGEAGYMLKQYHNGIVVCSQFVPKKYFTQFCDNAGIDKNDIIYIDN